jgi:hypothetical protein
LSQIFGTLIVGIIFAIIGIAACIHYRWRPAKTYIPLAIGLSLIYLATIGPLSHSRERIEAITHLDPAQVVSIWLEPTGNSSYSDISLFRHNREINDTPTLHRIVHLLQLAVPAMEGYIKAPTGVGRIEITLRNLPPIIFAFRKNADATCLSIVSNGDSGWHYGLLDAPGLGPLLDSLAATRPR